MIHQGSYWKEQLERIGKSLASRTKPRRWTERETAKSELDVVTGFYSIRRLLESSKIAESFGDHHLNLQAASNRVQVNRLNRGAIFDLYDLGHPTPVKMTLWDLCNQFVHSYILHLAVNERGQLCGAFVSSDRDRNKRVLFVSALQLIAIFKEISEDESSVTTVEYSQAKKDFVGGLKGKQEGWELTAVVGADAPSDELMHLLIKSRELLGMPIMCPGHYSMRAR